MARGVNRFYGIGNIGQDPDIRFMPNGNAVANFSVAINETWNDKATGQKQERTEWIRCVAFNKLAEIIQQYAHKGSKVYIEGKLQTRKWQGQDGKDNYTTEVVLNDMQMQDSANSNGADKRAANQAESYPQSQYGQQAQQQAPQQTQQQQSQQFQRPQQNAYQQQSGGTVNSSQHSPNPQDFDQEIPF